jgi:Cell shape-determining protein
MKKLKEQLNELYNDIADYDSVKEENEELRSMLELKEQNNDFTFSAPAQIISRLTNDPFAAFVIDKGMADGVNPYDPVVTSQGLVGICYDVSYTTSKVRTMFSPKTAVGVITVRTKATGIVEGDYTTAKDGYYKMRYIDKEADVKPGDIVMTSGSKLILQNSLSEL